MTPRDSPPPPREADKARVWYAVWKIGTMILLGGLIYMPVVAEGFRMLIPALGRRAPLGLDPAKILALFMMIAVWSLWELSLMAFLKIEVVFERSVMDPKAFKKLVVILGGVLLVCDGLLFYIAMTKLGWRGGILSFPALLATLCWLAVLIFVSWVSVLIKSPILKGEDRR